MGDIPEFTTRPELAGTFGMVASTHWLASAAGMAVLEQGGNAFDAAVAAGLVLQVTEPHLNGLGGEVPVIAHHAGRQETFVLCGQGTAPAAATPGAFGDLGLDLVPGQRPARRLRARRVRRLDAAAAGVRHAAAAGRDGLRDRLRGRAATRCCPRSAGASPAWPTCSATTGRARPRSTCRTARCPRRAPCSPTRRWPPPTGASWTRPKQPAATATSRSRRPGGSSTRASWPRRSPPTSPPPR